jgi:transposase
LRAARLLAEIGDARGRFPTPEALASLAGVAPSTRQSGKSRLVGFVVGFPQDAVTLTRRWIGQGAPRAG